MPEEIEDALREELPDTPTLIKTYGEFWNPELVNWNKSRELLGKRRYDLKGPDINVYEERGVYVLYKEYLPVYVGKADKESIGNRLQLHRQSRRRGPRWDRFSWYGIVGLRTNGKLRSRTVKFHPSTAQFIATLEALLIRVIDPKLNSRREKFKNALRLHQSEPETGRPLDIEERLESIETKLQEVLTLRG
jgi:hypothetical protein